MIKFTIERVEVYPEVGLTIGEDKTEAFDFGDIELKNTTISTAYIFGDLVEVTIGSVIKYYIVEEDRLTQVTDTLYDHFITLTEITARLVKEIHTDRYFTVKSDGTPYTLAEIAEILVDTEPFGKNDLWRIEPETLTVLDVESKELKMKQRNVFQKYVQLFKNIKAVPRLDYRSALSHTYYNSINNPITLGDLISSNKTISANDYANTILTKASNLVGDAQSSINRGVWFPTKTSGITVRATKGDYDDSNAEFQLPMAIRKMYRVKIMNLATSTLGTISADITDYVKSKEEFDKLQVGSNSALLDSQYQRNTLYFTKGGNTVTNMGNTYKVLLINIDVMEALIRSWLEEQVVGAGITEYVAQDINDYEFNFWFQPYNDIDISRERFRNDVTKRAMILSNQRESIIELQRYAGVMGDTIKRLPNGNWLITKEYTNFADRFELGDYTSDNYQIIKSSFIVYSETRIIGFHELAQYWATLDGQQSTNREPQPYTLSKETANANFRYTEYIELSTTSRTTTGGLTAQGFRTLLNLFDYYSGDNLPIVLAQYTNVDSNQSTSAINVATFSTASEGGINLITGFLEPLLASNQLDKVGNDELVPIRYTDEGGGVDKASFKFINDVTINPDDHPLSAYQSATLFELNDKTYSLDPNEILGLNVELLWSSDEDGIIVGDRMNESCNLTWEYLSAQDVNLAIYTSDITVQYNDMDKLITDYHTKTINNAGQISINKTLRSLTVNAAIANGTWAIGFAADDTLIMAVNYNGTSRRTIYFNNLIEKTGIESLLSYKLVEIAVALATTSSISMATIQYLNYTLSASMEVTSLSELIFEHLDNQVLAAEMSVNAISEILSSQRLNFGVIAEMSVTASSLITSVQSAMNQSLLAEMSVNATSNITSVQSAMNYSLEAQMEVNAIIDMVSTQFFNQYQFEMEVNATSSMTYNIDTPDETLVAEMLVTAISDIEYEFGLFNYELEAIISSVSASLAVTMIQVLNYYLIAEMSTTATLDVIYQVNLSTGIEMSVTATSSMTHTVTGNQTLAASMSVSTSLDMEFDTIEPTVSPSIVDYGGGADINNYPYYWVYWKVQNNDARTVTAKSDARSGSYIDPPTSPVGSLAWLDKSSLRSVTGYSSSGINVYISANADTIYSSVSETAKRIVST